MAIIRIQESLVQIFYLLLRSRKRLKFYLEAVTVRYDIARRVGNTENLKYFVGVCISRNENILDGMLRLKRTIP